MTNAKSARSRKRPFDARHNRDLAVYATETADGADWPRSSPRAARQFVSSEYGRRIDRSDVSTNSWTKRRCGGGGRGAARLLCLRDAASRRRAAVIDRGIDASRCVGPAALGTGRVCGGGGGAARGTRAGRRAWGGGRSSSCASPRRCARWTSERGPRRFSEAPRRSDAFAPQRSCGRGANVRCPATEPAA